MGFRFFYRRKSLGGGLSAGLSKSGVIAVVVIAMFVWASEGALSDAQTPSALRVEVSGVPQRVHASDGREHIEYNLIITNAFTADATLRSLEVLGDGRPLLSLSAAALGAVTLPLLAKPNRRPCQASVYRSDSSGPRAAPLGRAHGAEALDQPNQVCDPGNRSTAAGDRDHDR